MNQSNRCRHYECYLHRGLGQEERKERYEQHCLRGGEGCPERQILDSVRPIKTGGRI